MGDGSFDAELVQQVTRRPIPFNGSNEEEELVQQCRPKARLRQCRLG